MKMNSIIAFAGTLLILAACGQKQEKFLSSEDGYRYKYINKGDGPKPEEGKYFMFNLSYGSGDSVMFSSAESNRPTGAFCSLERWSQGGKFYNFLKEMKVGDSVILKIDAADFFNKTMRSSSLPPGVSEKDTVLVRIGASDIMDPFKFQMKANPNMKAQHDKDIKNLEDYFAENNIENVQTQENGLKYVVHEEGDGPKPETGDKVTVHYTGKLLDGTKFDSSVDRGEPFSFNIGQGQVIMGWDKGFLNLKEGSKATLYIPSTMAYGSRGAGQAIPPNSILIFDVELLEVNSDENS